MLIDAKVLARRYKMNVNGVLHVGAHTGEEAVLYDQLGWNPVYWIEADEDIIPILRRNIARRHGHHVVQAVCADEEKTVTFNIANNEESSSILEFGTHAAEHPDVVFVDTREVETTTLDLLYKNGAIGEANFMNLDVQGAELHVLKGGSEYIKNVNYVYSEVNRARLYQGGALFAELAGWLAEEGFIQTEVQWTRHQWGDAFFIREDLL